MAIFYRPVVRDQVFLLPPDVRDWLPDDHLVWTLIEMVGRLDTSAFHAGRSRGAGRAGYDPDMLLTVLLLGYCLGVHSSRGIERACHTDAAFRIACAQDVPDHTVLARFRAAHEDAFIDLFAQVLVLAAGLGMVRFGTVAIDGTKIAANASLGANREQPWLDRQREELAEDLTARKAAAAEAASGIVATAAGADEVEDVLFGDARGDEIPAEYADLTARRARLDELAAELEASKATMAAERAEQESAARSQVRTEALRRGEAPRGVDAKGVDPIEAAALRLARARMRAEERLRAWQERFSPDGTPPTGRPAVPVEDHHEVREAQARLDARTAQRAASQAAEAAEADGDGRRAHDAGAEDPAGNRRDGRNRKDRTKKSPPRVNLTDPQSRIQPTRKGWLQGYNAQFAVTGDQIIVACSLGQSSADDPQFQPMLAKVIAEAARLAQFTGTPMPIGTVLADAGYNSNANLTTEGPDRLIAMGKSRGLHATARDHPTSGDPDPDATPGEKMAHRLATPEGAALYKRRGATVEPGIGNFKALLDTFSRRGVDAATSELNLAATAHNLLKIWRVETA